MSNESLSPIQGENLQVASPFAIQQSGGGALAAMTSNAAAVETMASIWIAKQYPRDPAEVTFRMNQACSRKSLADAATYAYKRGGSVVEGPSIRLAEALLGAYGNMEAGWREVSRRFDESKKCGVSECVSFAFDKEANVRREIAFTCPHLRDKNVVEGKNKRMIQEPVTSERDIYELCANMASRRIRACILQVLPAWLVEEAMDAIKKTLENGDKRTPLDIMRSLEAKFREFGVTKAMIEKNLGHRLEEATRPDVVRLGKIYNSLVDGMVHVSDVFQDDVAASPPGKTPPPVPDPFVNQGNDMQAEQAPSGDDPETLL